MTPTVHIQCMTKCRRVHNLELAHTCHRGEYCVYIGIAMVSVGNSALTFSFESI